jgi:hypothetical protein
MEELTKTQKILWALAIVAIIVTIVVMVANSGGDTVVSDPIADVSSPVVKKIVAPVVETPTLSVPTTLATIGTESTPLATVAAPTPDPIESILQCSADSTWDPSGLIDINGTTNRLCDDGINSDTATCSPDGSWTYSGCPITTFVNKFSNKCLDNPYGSTEAQAPIWVYDCYNTENPVPGTRGETQQWFYNSADNTIKNPESGLCLNIPDANFTNGAPVGTYPCNGHDSQKFIYDKDSKAIQVKAKPNMCVDQDASSTNVIVWDCHGGANQQWN